MFDFRKFAHVFKIIIATSTVHHQIHHSQLPGAAQQTPRAILEFKFAFILFT